MSHALTLSAEDGHQLAAYRATPAGTPRGALVVIQEIFGVNSHIKKVSDGWAADGYVALAPALFDRVERGVDMGYGPEDIQQGRELRGKISTDDSVKDVRAAVRELARTHLRVGVVGYCWGGTMAWLAATRIEGLSATVGYYGGGIADTAEESAPVPGDAPLRGDRHRDPEGALREGAAHSPDRPRPRLSRGARLQLRRARELPRAERAPGARADARLLPPARRLGEQVGRPGRRIDQPDRQARQDPSPDSLAGSLS